MLKLFFLLLSIILTYSASPQGSWNIGYIPVDSLNNTHPGRIVRIDFKAPKADNKTSITRNVRSYFKKTDTLLLVIDSSSMLVAERRKIYVDHGNYYDQYLECLNCKDLILRFYDAEILEVDAQTISFKIERRHTNTKWKRTGTGWVHFRIGRDKLDGVFYKLE